MSEQIHHFTHESLSLNQAHSYNLLLQINAGSFNYAIIFNNELLKWVENCPADELREPKTLHDVLTANFKQVIVGLASTGFTLVPDSLFDNGHVADMARLLEVRDNEDVYHQHLDKKNLIIYKASQQVNRSLADFDSPVINYKATGWVKAISGDQPTNKDLFVNVADEVAEFLYFLDVDLRLYNSFVFKNCQELAYYCAFVSSELNIEPRYTTVIISGDINAADECLTYLADFFREVRLNPMQILELPQNVAPHKILTLAALSLCASSEAN